MIDWSQSKDPRSTKQLIEDGMRVMQETVVIPNAWLPQDWHDNKRGGRTLARLNKMCDKQEGITEHKKLKATKARNIEAYRQQFEQEGKFDYDQERNEDKLYANQQAWCRFCPSIDLDSE